MRERIAAWLFRQLIQHVSGLRPPDFVVGHDNPEGAYLRRWYITPWRGWYRAVPEDQRTLWQRAAVALAHLLPNLYLHQFLRDDDDRALHDHPSWAVSFILHGAYLEHTVDDAGVARRRMHRAGSLRFLPLLHTHRIELLREVVGIDPENEAAPYRVQPAPCWTLFLFGPKRREWGFHCEGGRWVPWQEFTATGKPGEVGKGCDA
ncbi:hypothetical protein [Pseudoxanthomonas sp. USHLN014]|uniref:hypothetical protein n=1 Tax=Pseudoxanthomonas sp. USHLN014 TaxID=3081297 RepID=UPI00301CAC45